MKIKVMIVEDDKLVRNGLISTMPWEQFNMEVIGEAKNGEKALEFLKANPVDLIITDLAMPVMSGIELMRIIHKSYPNIFVVVLSLHQDFEYIQEAMRLGAIDYIAKVELDEECFENILGRIYNRVITEKKRMSVFYNNDLSFPLIETNDGLVEIILKENNESLLYKSLDSSIPQQLKLDSHLNLFPLRYKKDLKSVLNKLKQIDTREYLYLHITGLKDQELNEIKKLLLTYKEKGVFYDLNYKDYLLNKTVSDLNNDLNNDPSIDQEEILTELESLNWVYDSMKFKNLLSVLKNLRYSKLELTNLILLTVNEWNRLYYPITSKKIDLSNEFFCWIDVEKWFYSIKDEITKVLSKPSHSDDVKQCIHKALKYIDEEFHSEVHASDIANRVNMSRSYFSQCFKDIVGMTFNEYVRYIRVEKAKAYLLKTDHKIRWIAEHIGYLDVKYFSKVFKESTGMLPSEYRQINGEKWLQI